ncbi:chloride channel protein [Oceanithermus sp.]
MERRHVLSLIGSSTVIGFIVGLVAAAFTWALFTTQNLLLGELIGYLPPGYSGENGVLHTFRNPHPLALVLLLPLIFAVASLFGHNRGLSKIIASFHQGKPGTLGEKLRYALGSLVELGAGSPLGREGPMAVLGNWIGDALGRRFLSDETRSHLPFAGMAAGFAAAFHAPVGGALLAVEIFYPGLVLEIGSLGPALIGGLAGFVVYGAFWGYEPLLNLKPLPPHLYHVGFALLVGVLMAIVGTVWMLAARLVRLRTARMSYLPRHALLGLVIAAVAVFLPQVTGDGLVWVEMSSAPLLSVSFILQLAVVRLLVLSVALGLGGYGALIGPALALGGLFAIALARAFPAASPDAATAALVGMSALLAGVVRTPFAALLLVSEIGGYATLPLTLPAVFTSYLLTTAHAFPEQNLGAGELKGAPYAGLRAGELPFTPKEILRGGQTLPASPDEVIKADDVLIPELSD